MVDGDRASTGDPDSRDDRDRELLARLRADRQRRPPEPEPTPPLPPTRPYGRRFWFLLLVQLPVAIVFGLSIGRSVVLASVVGVILLVWVIWSLSTMVGGRCEVCGTWKRVVPVPVDNSWQRAWWDPRPPKRSKFHWVCTEHFDVFIRGLLLSRTRPPAGPSASPGAPGTSGSPADEVR